MSDYTIDWKIVVQELSHITGGEKDVVSNDWDDSIFMRSYYTKIQLSSRPSDAETDLYLKAWISWMSGGPIPENIVLCWLGVFLKMKDSQDNFLFRDEAFTAADEFKWLNPGNAPVAENFKYEGMDGVQMWSGEPVTKMDNPRDWFKFICDLIDKGDKKQHIINEIGFIIMILFRMCIKSEFNVVKHLMQEGERKIVQLWGEGSLSFPIMCPSKSMILNYRAIFQRLTPNNLRCLTTMVDSYRRCGGTHKTPIEGILRAGCLLSLQKTGLGIMHWTQRAADQTGTVIIKLVDYMALPEYHSVNWTMINLIRKGLGNPKGQITWPWARIFDDSALADLGVRAHPCYAAVMMLLATGNISMGNALWEIDSINTLMTPEIKKRAIEVATNILNDLKISKAASAESDNAKKVWKQVMIIPPEDEEKEW